MKIIEVPIYNADGSVQFTQHVTAEEAQALLQFAINFLAASGMAAVMKIDKPTDAQMELPLTVQ